MSVGTVQRTRSWARFHWQASCSVVSPWRSAIGRMRSRRSRPACTQPSGRKARWSCCGEGVAGPHVVPEEPAVVDHARDEVDVVAPRRGQHELAGPRLERVEDDHRPVDQRAEALQAVDDVEREAVGRAGGDAEHPRQAGVAQRRHPLPHRGARVADAIGVVQEQQVEAVGPDALQRALGRHAQVRRVLLGPAQARVGEAREALGALALAFVEVVAHGADQAVGLALDAAQRAAEQLVGLARPVGVGRQDGVDAVAGAQQGGQALVVDRLAEAHEAPAAPGADGDVSGVRHAPECMTAQAARGAKCRSSSERLAA